MGRRGGAGRICARGSGTGRGRVGGEGSARTSSGSSFAREAPRTGAKEQSLRALDAAHKLMSWGGNNGWLGPVGDGLAAGARAARGSVCVGRAGDQGWASSRGSTSTCSVLERRGVKKIASPWYEHSIRLISLGGEHISLIHPPTPPVRTYQANSA